MTNLNKKYKIAIVWANPYNKNLGVGALAYSSLSLLNDVLKENKIEADLSFFGTSQIGDDLITIGDQVIPFKNVSGMDLLSFKSFVKLIFFPRRFNTKEILSYDFIFDIAEGDSFTDIYGDERFRRILNSKKFFNLLAKKQILLPQTIGPFKDKKHEEDAFKTMAKLDLIISRDRQSYNYTTKFLPTEKILESIDVAFYMPYEQSSYTKDKIHFGLNVSGLLWNGGYTKNNQFDMKTDYRELIYSVMEYFSQNDKVQIHLVPHVVPLEHAVEDDYSVSEELKKKFPNAILAPRFSNPIVAKGYISGLDFFSGARMHACISAFATGVPVFPMAYSRKFNGLFVDTLEYEWMGDCVHEKEDKILANMIEAFNKREVLADQINNANKTIVLPRLNQLKSIIKDFVI
jgi:polysaccharide pyruvyl transferase WcaK-like protein